MSTTPTVVVPRDERERIAEMVRTGGERATAEVLEVSAPTLARAVAGFGVTRGVAALLRARLLATPRPSV